MNGSDYRAFILILVVLSFCKKETISITVISVTFRDGDDGPDRCWPNNAYPSTFICHKIRVCW